MAEQKLKSLELIAEREAEMNKRALEMEQKRQEAYDKAEAAR